MVNWGSSSKLGRPSQPSEVAASYIFLASREAALFSKFIISIVCLVKLDANIFPFKQTGRFCTVTLWAIKPTVTSKVLYA